MSPIAIQPVVELARRGAGRTVTPRADRCRVPPQAVLRRGLTLLEMLLVVFILSVVALGAVSLTDQLDSQFRFEDTRSRLAQIRTAVAGDPTTRVNGEPVASGFAADVGRLPHSLAELLIRPDGNPPWDANHVVPVWHFNPATGQWAGWRGPYLSAVVDRSTLLPAFRDGWGNRNTGPVASSANPGIDAANFGWQWLEVAGNLCVQSVGSDGQVGFDPAATDATFAADYPLGPLASAVLAGADDHLVDLRALRVSVRLLNRTGDAWPPAGTNYRLRFHYPINDPANGLIDWEWETTWPSANRDEANFLSLLIPPPQNPDNAPPPDNEGETGDDETNPTPQAAEPNTIAHGKQYEVLVPMASPSVNVPKPIPWGLRSISLVRDEDGQPVLTDPPVQTVMLLPRAQQSVMLFYVLHAAPTP